MASIDSVWLHWPETKALAQAVSPLRFVGGCVRDALLNREVKDVDAATPLPPQEVMRLLQNAGIKAIPTGLDHGTVTARLCERHFEITTLRHDVETDGRHATVAFTDDWKEDAARRDFTMNALYCDANGEVFDYFGGLKDAEAGHVRFIGDASARIREDALRILRFFRFFAHYGKGAIDAAGVAACGELAPLIDKLSGERIAQEMLRLLTADSAGEVVGIMQRHGVWPFVVPAVVKTDTLALLPPLLRKAECAKDAVLALALLLRTTQGDRHELVDSVAQRWRLSNAQGKRLRELCEHSAFPSPLTGEGQGGGGATATPPSLILPRKGGGDVLWKKQIRLWGRELFIDRALLAMAEGAEEASMLAAIKFAREWTVPVFPVTGDDLIAQGVKPGRELGAKLKELEAKWEEGGYAFEKDELLKRL